MFNTITSIFNKLTGCLRKTFFSLYISSKFLFFIAFFSFIIVSVSVFIPNLDATGNLVTIRTLFSSVIGWLLERSTKIVCKDNVLYMRNCCIGFLSLGILLILALAAFWDINVNNPSLLLLKNTIFSAVGFLISSSQSCDK